MRTISFLLVGAALTSCAATPEPPTRSAQSARQYDQLLAGKVAQAPVNCLPSYNANDMVVIDESTVAFKQGSSRVYVNHMQGGCTNLGGGYALLTKGFSGTGLCRGDVAQVVDIRNHMTVGSCAFGEFIPYVRPRA
jgi:hypothetical protein